MISFAVLTIVCTVKV